MLIAKRLALLSVLLCFCGQAMGQVEMATDRSLNLPLFFLDIVNARAKDPANPNLCQNPVSVAAIRQSRRRYLPRKI